MNDDLLNQRFLKIRKLMLKMNAIKQAINKE
mgnify:CR=1 FL=1